MVKLIVGLYIYFIMQVIIVYYSFIVHQQHTDRQTHTHNYKMGALTIINMYTYCIWIVKFLTELLLISCIGIQELLCETKSGTIYY